MARMNHRYRAPGGSGEPIEVVEDKDGAPAMFCWRGRRYAVDALVATWVEAMPWWVEQGYGQRHVWRVEAVPHTGTPGVYDLYRVSCGSHRQWGLERVLD
jgi:hypothetical protein